MREQPAIDWIVSDNQRDALSAPIARALAAAPHWLTELTVRYDPALEDGILSINTHEEYRVAGLKVADAYFADTERQRWLAPVHEIVHLHFGRLAALYQSLLTATTDEGDALRKWADEEWRKAEEASVCDLAEVVNRLLPGGEGND